MNEPIPPPSKRCRWLILIAMAGMVFAADQLSKFWLLNVYEIAARAPVRLSENFVLVMAWNRGVSFSLFTHSASFMPYLLSAVACVISAILLRLYLKTDSAFERVGYAMIMGGALGNAFDRLRFGAVADFFYLHVGPVGWPAFNVADMAICTGVGLLLCTLFKKPARP